MARAATAPHLDPTKGLQEALSQAAGFHQKTLQRIYAGEWVSYAKVVLLIERGIRESTAILSNPDFYPEGELPPYLQKVCTERKHYQVQLDDRDVETIARSVDRQTHSFLQASPPSLDVKEVYRSLLTGSLVRLGTGLEDFLEVLRHISPSSFTPSVFFDLNYDFTKLRIKSADWSLPLNSPVLLWDCSCVPEQINQLLGKRRFLKKGCRIHTHPHGDILTDLNTIEVNQLSFRNVHVIWRQNRELWPPSVDSVLLMKQLQDSAVLRSLSPRSVLDLGCGTGFLGISAAKTYRGIQTIDFADWLLMPLLFSSLNAKINLNSTDWQIHLGLFDDWILNRPRGPYDLLLCAPPYLPLVDGFDKVKAESPVAGVELLEFVLANYKRLAKTSILVFSDMALPSLSTNHLTDNLKKLFPSLEVPFRVPAALRNPTYIESLLDKKLINFKPSERHPFWHRVGFYAVS